jgi:UDP-N-acetylmuramoylalanine--D-glutamate ligase
LDRHHDVGVDGPSDIENSLIGCGAVRISMQLRHWEDKRVLVVGLGESGLAMVRFCLLLGAHVRVCDTRENPPHLAQLQGQFPQLEFQSGLSEAWLEQLDYLLWSPGLSPHSQDAKPFLAAAAERNLKPWGEAEVFAQALAAMQIQFGYRPKVLAITGTNGKTTTTMLTAFLCKSAGLHAVAAGNVSPAMLDALADALESDHLPQVWVLELSSFQLVMLEKLPCDAATVLNLTEDHLDWHADFAEYREAKHRIYRDTVHSIYNRDDAQTQPALRPKVKFNPFKAAAKKAELPVSPVLTESVQTETPEVINYTVASFGLDEPKQHLDFGVIRVGGIQWLAEAIAIEEDMPGKRKTETPKPWRSSALMPVELPSLLGLHNRANILAALALCKAIGLSYAKLLRALPSYKGEPHRCSLVRQLDGVDYVDDSKGTNVGASVAALRGMGKPVVLIAGGEGKGQSFFPLIEAIEVHARHVLLIGKSAEQIAEDLGMTAIPSTRCSSLEEAVEKAQALAQSGDVVLLSPACASLDMFQNYKHRAEVFVAAVNSLTPKLIEPENSALEVQP